MTKKSSVSGKILTTLILVITLGLSIALADLFSSVITVNNIYGNSNTLVQGESTYYGISIHKSLSKSEATSLSKDVKKTGGAGFVWSISDFYHVMASVYQNLNDAEKVKNNLLELQSITSEVVTIKIPEIKLKNEYAQEKKELIENSLLIYKTTYMKLYDLSVSLDTGILKEMEVKLRVNDVNSDFLKIKNNFETLLGQNLNSDTIIMSSKFKDFKILMDNLIAETKEEYQSYSSLLKQSYCNVIYNYYKLIREINGKII